MPSRLNLIGVSRSLAIRSRPSIASRQSRIAAVVPRRGYANEKDTNQPTGPNQGGGLGHVSEEAADMSKVTGETGPDLGQGTPVQEVGLTSQSCWTKSMTSEFDMQHTDKF
jgi:small subunit ribosomal protein S7